MFNLNDNLPACVTVVEVGPRDGLQDEAHHVDSQNKIRLVDQLTAAGLARIEVSAFVHAERVPQLADAAEVFAGIKRRPGVQYAALIPNLFGLQRAFDADADAVSIFTAASETFSQRNMGCSIEDALQGYVPVVAQAREHRLPLRAYISCCWGCPFEGEVALSHVRSIVERLYAMGCDEIVLADTIGVATPRAIQDAVNHVAEEFPRSQLALHLHDTRGQALANVLAALLAGITIFDSAVAGLGGCPFAPGANGNLATEDLLYLLHGMAITTGVDLPAVIDAGRTISATLQHNNHSRTGQAGIILHDNAC